MECGFDVRSATRYEDLVSLCPGMDGGLGDHERVLLQDQPECGHGSHGWCDQALEPE